MFRLMVTALLFGLVSMQCNAEFRDPTQPAYPLATDDAAAVGGIPLVLSAIWISSQSRRATINGIIVKRGQTIKIKQNPALNPKPANPSTAGDKENERINNTLPPALNQLNGTTNKGTGRPAPENNADLLEKMAGPMGSMIAPLLSTATGSMDIPQLQDQNTRQQANTAQPSASMQSPNTVPKPVRSSTIKIIGIHKNSVTIDQDGERKTLQLVHRPYKTQ